MLIRNIKSSADGEAQKMLAMKLLEIEASNEAYLDKVKSAYRDPNKPPPVPPRYRDSTEIALDIFGNQLKLIALFESWGIKPQQANAVVKGLKPDEVLKILSAPGNLKKKFEGIGKDYLNVNYISNIVERFIQNFDRTLGGAYENATDYIAHSFGSAAKIFPSVGKVVDLYRVLGAIKEEYDKDTSRVGDVGDIEAILKSLDDYGKLMSEVEKKENNPNDPSTIALRTLMQTGRIPMATAIDEQLKIYTIMLGKIKSKTVNPQEAKNSFIATSNLLSNPEINNLLSQITGLTQKNNELAQDIEEARKSADLDKISNLEFAKNKNISIGNARIVLNNPNLKSTDRTYKKQVINHYIKLYNEGKSYEDIKRQYNAIEDGVAQPIVQIQQTVQNPSQRDKELKVAIANQFTENPQASKKYNENLEKQIGEMDLDIMLSSVYGMSNKELIDEQERLFNTGRRKQVENVMDDMLEAIVQGGEDEEEFASQFALSEYQEENYGSIEDLRKITEKDFNSYNLSEQNEILDILRKSNPDTYQKRRITRLQNIYYDNVMNEQTAEDEAAVALGKELSTPIFGKQNTYGETKGGNGIKNKVKIPQYQKLPVEYGGSISKNNLGFSHRKIKVGKGIGTEEKPKFIQFGKYLLNTPHLYNDSKLTLRFPSGGAIPTIKPINISEDFREFLIDLIENEKISQPLYKSVNEQEKAWFEKVCKGAGLVHKFNIKPKADDTESKELTRYKLLVGEVEAGNNNKDIIKELRSLILKFVKSGRMSKTDGNYMLTELSVI